MALIKCPECKKEVSDKASICIGCGYPFTTNESKLQKVDKPINGFWSFLAMGWQAVTDIRAPINVFTFGIMLCSVTFALSSINIGKENIEAFKYATHMSIGIIGFFYIIILFCPKSLYRPEELANLAKHSENVKMRDEPIKAIITALIGVVSYMCYQFFWVK